MDIIFKVSQATVGRDNQPYSILPTLFEVEPLHCKQTTSIDDFTTNLLIFQKHLKEVFDTKKYPQILYACDNVLAKIDFCVEFSFGNYNKHHKISSPLSLFVKYNEESIKDASLHIFVALADKWQEFYNDFKKKDF